MVLELFDIFNECSGSDVEGAALVVTETYDDAHSGLADFIEHLFGGNGLIDADGVDPQVVHQPQVLGQGGKTSHGISNGDGMVTHAVDAVDAVGGVKLLVSSPNLRVRLRTTRNRTNDQDSCGPGQRDVINAFHARLNDVPGARRDDSAARSPRNTSIEWGVHCGSAHRTRRA